MKRIMKLMAVAAVGAAMVSCSNKEDLFDYAGAEQTKTEAYAKAFTDAFGAIAPTQNWGFSNSSVVYVSESDVEKYPSPLYVETANARGAITRSGSTVTPQKYTELSQLETNTNADAYFFVRISNEILEDEARANDQSQWLGISATQYYPLNGSSSLYSTGNHGIVDATKLTGSTNSNYPLYKFNPNGVDESILKSCPDFNEVVTWFPENIRSQIKEKYYKVIWYVAKWQNKDKPGGDDIIHVDGVLVSKTRRVIAEDLGTIGDFDFNDVVFDVTAYEEGGKDYAEVTLLAAGGTMPIYIGKVDQEREVHYLFDADVKEMVNTGAGVTREPVKFTIEISSAVNWFEEIKVYVVDTQAKDPRELKANRGQAPEKICVTRGYDWTKTSGESHSLSQRIDSQYPLFPDYVSGAKDTPYWYSNDITEE